ncbi:DUF2169 domain-containing protein [Acidovorax cavernicola]|uniref:DUF2169 domain-containing protein n=1 Tax=Acidovorax cavernicola TaxID=1675792 RepID=A0A9X8GSZ9_9BURK|nr:DUF2169 domain-containing protein [Acidovorax cavernicola]RIX74284.1 DUF2169 domain-containing protein [Acidovorax cavernicola]
MKFAKPSRLSLLQRPYRWEGKDRLGVSVLGLISLGPEPRLHADPELWKLATEQIGPGNVLDLAIPKRVPEWLLSGNAYTAHQHDKTACAVQVRIGGLQKSLTVFGDRYWLGSRATEPRAFEHMPLDWAHAYGGPMVAENPLGIGSQDELINGVATRRLPHIESPTSRMAARGQHIEPAGFGAMPPDWLQRLRLVGSDYGQAWLEQHYPGFAKDMDWRYFNAAAADQRWEGASEIPATASYELWNMHPSEPVLSGRLPAWQARCFASRQLDGEALEEAAMRLTTVWFFPHMERAILIWHGAFDIAEDDGADVRHLMPALEWADAPRPLAHYQSVLKVRLDPSKAVLALRDADLMPREVMAPWAAEQLPDLMARPMVRNLHAGRQRHHENQRAELLRRGLDPSKYMPEQPDLQPPRSFDELPEYSERLEQQFKAMQDELHGRNGQAAPAGAASTPAPARKPFDADRLQAELQRMKSEFERKAAERQASGKPAQNRIDPEEAMRRFDRIDQTDPRLQKRAPTTSEDAQAAAEDRERRRALMYQGHLYTAHLLDPAPVASSFRSAKLRRRLAQAAPQQRHFARMNLAGVDLSEMDLRGADFSGANLEDANLVSARLDGCNFSNAVLARARLAGASLVGARLDHTNLGAAQCDGTDFSEAHLSHALCEKAVFARCLFVGAHLAYCDLRESRWLQCDLRKSHWHEVTMIELSLEDLVYEEADLLRTSWIQCSLAGVSFARARLQSCSFVTARADQGLDFTDASLIGCSVVLESHMAGAVFRGAMLKRCGLRGTRFEAADFTDACLENCDFSECDLRRAQLERAIGADSLFIRTDLGAASLRDANLMDANLSKADLRLADLSEANLFRADVSQARIDLTTQLDGAYTQDAKIRPVRRAEPGG